MNLSSQVINPTGEGAKASVLCRLDHHRDHGQMPRLAWPSYNTDRQKPEKFSETGLVSRRKAFLFFPDL